MNPVERLELLLPPPRIPLTGPGKRPSPALSTIPPYFSSLFGPLRRSGAGFAFPHAVAEGADEPAQGEVAPMKVADSRPDLTP